MMRFKLEDVFPEAEAGESPCGNQLLVQLFKVPRKTSGNVHLPDDVVDLEQGSVVYGKVKALGPNAYRVRASGEQWGAGPWTKVGDIVRLPRNRTGDFFRAPDGSDVSFFFVLDENVYSVVDPRVITGGFFKDPNAPKD